MGSNASLSAMEAASKMIGFERKPDGFFCANEYVNHEKERGVNITRHTAQGQLDRMVREGKLEKIFGHNRQVFYGLPRSKDNASPSGMGKRKRV